MPRTRSSLKITFALLFGLLSAGAISVYATSLGTNLFVTGTAGIASTSPWGLLSVNPSGVSGPEFVIGSSTATHLVVTNGGNVGIGTTSPASLFSVAGNGYFTGNVGIGTASPQTGLVVYGSNTNTVTAFGSEMGITLRNTSNTTGNYTSVLNYNAINNVNSGIYFKNIDQSFAGQIDFVTRSLSGTFQVGMSLDKSGNLGLGTTTPNWLLQVAGTRPSLALSDTSQTASSNLQHWLLSSMGGNLYVGTSTGLYATSTPAALTILNNRPVAI